MCDTQPEDAILGATKATLHCCYSDFLLASAAGTTLVNKLSTVVTIINYMKKSIRIHVLIIKFFHSDPLLQAYKVKH